MPPISPPNSRPKTALSHPERASSPTQSRLGYDRLLSRDRLRHLHLLAAVPENSSSLRQPHTKKTAMPHD